MSLPDIAALIPHRPPFRFVDEAVRLEPDVGEFLLRLSPGDERLAQGTLEPLLIVEALTQSAAAWHGALTSNRETGFLAQIERASLGCVARVGDLVCLRVERKRVLGQLVRFVGTAHCKGKLLAEAEFTVHRGDPAPVSQR